MNLNTKIALILICVIISSCKRDDKEANGSDSFFGSSNPSELDLYPSDYVSWIQDLNNGLKKEKTFDEITYSIQFKPYDYIVCQELKSDSIKEGIRRNKVNELNDMEYYDLKIGLANGEGELLKYNLNTSQEYDQRIKYFAFEMQKDISMVVDGDTIPCGLYHYERVYDVSPHTTLLLGFKKVNSKFTEKTILFHDEIFGKGIIKFSFSNKEQTNIPKLRTI